MPSFGKAGSLSEMLEYERAYSPPEELKTLADVIIRLLKDGELKKEMEKNEEERKSCLGIILRRCI